MVFEHAVRQIVLAEILPDVFRCIEFWTCRRQPHHRKIFWDLELLRGVPAGLVEKDQPMRAGSDRATDLIDMLLHGFGVGVRHDDRHSGIAARADCAKQIRVLVALILRLRRARALLRPLVGETVLCPTPLSS